MNGSWTSDGGYTSGTSGSTSTFSVSYAEPEPAEPLPSWRVNLCAGLMKVDVEPSALEFDAEDDSYTFVDGSDQVVAVFPRSSVTYIMRKNESGTPEDA